MTSFSTIISNIQAAMPNLNSSSATSFVSKIAEAIGQVLDNILAEFTNTQNIITELIVNKNFGHSQYYTEYALAYQDGDDLIVDTTTGKLIYATIDSNKQIISQAAFDKSNPTSLVLKVAYIDPSTGLLAALPTAKKTAFDSYFGNFEIPGIPISIISDNPNTLTFNAKITYNSNYNLATLQANIATALITFRDTFKFNGVFDDYLFENYIVNNVPGIISVYLSDTTMTDSSGAPQSFSGSTKLSAGYYNYGYYNLTYATI